jgi:hypothetical protein
MPDEAAKAQEAAEACPDAEGVRDLDLFQKLGIVQRRMRAFGWKKTLAAEDVDRKPGEKSKSFRTVSVDDMRQGLAAACAEARLIHMLEVTEDVVTLEKGYLYFHRGKGEVTYIDIDHPDQRITYKTTGEAMDTGDKAASKLESNLIKNHIKASWDVGEGGLDDIDSKTTDKLLEEAGRIEDALGRIEEKKRRREAAMANDPFFGDLSPLRRELVALMGKSEGSAKVVERYKAQHGVMTQWPKGVLEACIKECKEAGE